MRDNPLKVLPRPETAEAELRNILGYGDVSLLRVLGM